MRSTGAIQVDESKFDIITKTLTAAQKKKFRENDRALYINGNLTFTDNPHKKGLLKKKKIQEFKDSIAQGGHTHAELEQILMDFSEAL